MTDTNAHSEQTTERCEIVVEYDPDEITQDAIEDYFHEATHHVDHTNIVFSNTERFDYYE